jgi:putative phosphoesterase
VRVAVIADTHLPRGSRRLPDECVERLRAADLILHAGDLVSLSFLEELRGLGPPVAAVCGNMDERSVRDALPARTVVDADAARIGMVHDAGPARGRGERLAARFSGCGAVVYGHTHVAEVARVADTWVLNPGSPTERRRAPTWSMLELDVSGRLIQPRLIELS